jgi:hypothetical protein
MRIRSFDGGFTTSRIRSRLTKNVCFGLCSLTIVESDAASEEGWQFGNLAAQSEAQPFVSSFTLDQSATQTALHKGYCSILNLEER